MSNKAIFFRAIFLTVFLVQFSYTSNNANFEDRVGNELKTDFSKDVFAVRDAFKNFYFYFGSGSNIFGLPTLQFAKNEPARAAISAALCSLIGWVGYRWYKRILNNDRAFILEAAEEKYSKELHDRQEEINKELHNRKEKMNREFQERWKEQVEAFQAKNNEAQEVVKSNVRVYQPGDIEESFDSVAGMDAAKEDLNDIVLYLDDPESFEQIGARVPKGVLLSGPPGVGKTLLARALAGETDCPFLYINASEFSEMYVGRGAARVRNLFEVAREHAPCILFIDEFDAVARTRDGLSGSSGDAEHAQTLNQLLAEMDGFNQQEDPIILVAATNRVECLDPAVLRPGRLDKKVQIDLPRLQDRRKILNVHLKKVQHEEIDVDLLARGTVGFSGADLAQLINEAALIALREGEGSITMYHLDESRDVILFGSKETSNTFELTHEDLWRTAVHESGHALMRVYEEDALPLYKVTIRPRGGALGITFGMYDRDRVSRSQEEMLAEICVALGGSVAEELSYSGRGVGIHSDLQAARETAKSMVMHFGMTEGFKDVSFTEYIGREHALPTETSELLQKEIARIITECRAHVRKVISEHMDQLHEVSEALMKEGTLYGSEVYQICGKEKPNLEYTFVPVP